MAVKRHNEVAEMDDEAFAAWRERKLRELMGKPSSGAPGVARRRHAKDVFRRYIKMRRARQPAEEG